MNTNEKRNETEVRESKQFVDYIRGAIENRAEGNLAAGSNGAIIPKTIAKKVIKKAYDMSTILQGATKYNTKGNLSIPVYNEGDDGIAMAYKNEFAELESKSGNFTSIDL
ncbi:MAG: phage major capsid protein, partial [Lachnospiraceae bacterium]|nr:phage major capsid protein [Lachnospiraceae bacterium]